MSENDTIEPGDTPADSDNGTGDGNGDGIEGPDNEELSQQVETLQAELAEYKDQFLRAKAETENVRKRAEASVANAHKYAIEAFAAEVLAVRDSLELAQAVDLQADERAAVERMQEGLALTLRLMDQIFDKFSLQLVAPEKGDKFDPDLHQAMSMQESGEVAPNHILSVVQMGYRLNERLLRPAMVIVAQAQGPQTATAES